MSIFNAKYELFKMINREENIAESSASSISNKRVRDDYLMVLACDNTIEYDEDIHEGMVAIKLSRSLFNRKKRARQRKEEIKAKETPVTVLASDNTIKHDPVLHGAAATIELTRSHYQNKLEWQREKATLVTVLDSDNTIEHNPVLHGAAATRQISKAQLNYYRARQRVKATTVTVLASNPTRKYNLEEHGNEATIEISQDRLKNKIDWQRTKKMTKTVLASDNTIEHNPLLHRNMTTVTLSKNSFLKKIDLQHKKATLATVLASDNTIEHDPVLHGEVATRQISRAQLHNKRAYKRKKETLRDLAYFNRVFNPVIPTDEETHENIDCIIPLLYELDRNEVPIPVTDAIIDYEDGSSQVNPEDIDCLSSLDFQDFIESDNAEIDNTDIEQYVNPANVSGTLWSNRMNTMVEVSNTQSSSTCSHEEDDRVSELRHR